MFHWRALNSSSFPIEKRSFNNELFILILKYFKYTLQTLFFSQYLTSCSPDSARRFDLYPDIPSRFLLKTTRGEEPDNYENKIRAGGFDKH